MAYMKEAERLLDDVVRAATMGDEHGVQADSVYRDARATLLAHIQRGVVGGWKEATIAWEVCVSIHREYAKKKDPFFTTRQADFMRHAEAARAALLAHIQRGVPEGWQLDESKARSAYRGSYPDGDSDRCDVWMTAFRWVRAMLAHIQRGVPEGWSLDESEAALLHHLTSPDNDGEHSPITLRAGNVRMDDGTVKFGLLCEYTDYPDEGAALLVECLEAAPDHFRDDAGMVAVQPRVETFDVGFLARLGAEVPAPAEVPMPQGYAERPSDYTGDIWIESQMRAYGAACRAAGETAGYARGWKDKYENPWQDGYTSGYNDGVQDGIRTAALRGEVKP